ncbi:nuclear transport factor 2 family protein [Jannaschia sp. R86511]|uniref:nuclear transport factor 2 family protein n=1 Tax=Jannaschia sp. R86511 TaxID=3093853 RepID=UPI0036D43185
MTTTGQSTGQSTGQRTGTRSPDEATVEQQVLARMAQWRATFEAKDVDGMMTFYADGDAFSAFDLMPPLEFRGGAGWRANWVSFFAAWQGVPHLELTDVEVHGAGDLAVVRAMVRLHGTMSGQATDLWVRQTNVFRHLGGQWLMVHDHVSVPTDFATGRSLTDLSPHPAR